MTELSPSIDKTFRKVQTFKVKLTMKCFGSGLHIKNCTPHVSLEKDVMHPEACPGAAARPACSAVSTCALVSGLAMAIPRRVSRRLHDAR